MTILAAVDGSERSAAVVETGAELAEAFQTELLVVHVMPDAKFEERRESRPQYLADDAIRDAADVADGIIKQVVGDSFGDAIRPYGRTGDPVVEVLDAATTHQAQYLVIGGRKRSPAGKAFFGDVTQSVLLEADRPVVTVMQP